MSERNYPAVALHELSSMSDTARSELLLRTEDDLESFIKAVEPIIAAVRQEGDVALARFGREFDGATSLDADAIAATSADFDNAYDALDPLMIETLEYSGQYSSLS